MQVRVTADHIKRGKRRSESSCPIALALCEKLQVETQRGTSVGQMHLTVKGVRLLSKVPKKIVQFIEAFDKGSKVKPFTFTI